MTTIIKRDFIRRVGVTKPRVGCLTSTRGIVTGPPPPPPPAPGSEPKKESTQFNIPLLVGAVAACGAGYYYFAQEKAVGGRAKKDAEDVQRKASELEHAVRAQTKEKIEDAKEASRATIDGVHSRAQSTYEGASDKANAAVADVQERMSAYKDSAIQSYDKAVDSTKRGIHDAEAYAENTVEAAKSSWWSWLGWGKSKGEDAKREAAQKAAEGARIVKDNAADLEKKAQSRS